MDLDLLNEHLDLAKMNNDMETVAYLLSVQYNVLRINRLEEQKQKLRSPYITTRRKQMLRKIRDKRIQNLKGTEQDGIFDISSSSSSENTSSSESSDSPTVSDQRSLSPVGRVLI